MLKRFVAYYQLTPKTFALRLVRMVIALYVVLYLIQGYIIFPAYMANLTLGKIKTPAEYHLGNFSEIALTTSDNVLVWGWYHPPVVGKPVILYFPGNAMHLAARIVRYRAFVNKGYGVFALSYRGYGKSNGRPSEEGLYADARAAIQWLKVNATDTPILLYGESLGSGVATEMALEYNVKGLVLQSAYTSVADVAAETYWFMPFTHELVLYPFNSLSKMAGIHCPVLIIHGKADNQVPVQHGRKLMAAANSPKRFVEVQGAGHVNVPDTVILDAMRFFDDD